MTQNFIDAVETRNLASVRMMLCNELLLDPRGKSFAEMLQLAKDKLPDLFEAEKPSRFSIPSNPEEWDVEVLSQMKRDLNMNFSVEKLALFVEMAKQVGNEKAKALDEEEKRRREENGQRRSKERSTRKTTGTIVTGSGAVIAITGLCIEGTIGTVLSILGGAVVIGGVILLSTSGKSDSNKQAK